MILIPLISQPAYEELRYCLRAIEKYHPEQSVMIAGALPGWIKNVVHLPATDNPHHEFKARSIYSKIVEAFKYFDEFLFFNDDHIILAPVDYLHHKGPIDITNRQSNGTYTALLRNTLQRFHGANDYDTHCPIWYTKDKFEQLAQLDWNKPHGYGIKTSYCYLNELEGEYYEDLKFMRTIGNIENRLYFSTRDSCNLDPLKSLFNVKSKFER